MKRIILFQIIILLFVLEIKAQTTENITIEIGSVDLADSVNKPHMLGVIAGPSPNWNSVAPDLTSRYKDIGVTTIRNNDYQDDRLDMELMFFSGSYPVNQFTSQYPDWSGAPNNSGNYHFAESDAQFQNWLDGGFLPFFRLGGENAHPSRPHDYKGPRINEEQNYITAGINVVNRYNNFNGSTNTLAGYLDIWTEYPQKNFWDRDSISFNNFWCNTFDSLKNNFPGLKIGGPGFNTSVSTQIGNSINGNINTHVDLFLKELYSRKLKPDWIGFHVFSNNIDDFCNTAIAYRKLLRSESPFNSYASIWGSGDNSYFNDVELICDAWGFDNDQSLSSSARDSIYNRQFGAAHHTGAFIALQQSDIERAYIYRGGEFGNDSTTAVMGLFYGTIYGTYKPVAYAFKLCSKMQTIYNKKLTSPVYDTTSGGSKIWTLAGEDIDGNKAILISNPTANTINLSLTLNGNNLSTSLYPYINQYTVTDNNDGQTPSQWNNGVFVLPPYTSHLITMRKSITDVENQVQLPTSFTLSQNYPNPFNPSTNISFSIPSTGFVQIKIFNTLGQGVKTLINNEMNAGTYKINFDASSLSSGVYFYQLAAGDFKQIKKMVLLK